MYWIGQEHKPQVKRRRRLKAHNALLPNPQTQLKYTIKEIGRGIREGSHYVPIIKHAQRLASRAGPKDYLGQIKQLYSDFVQRWRYVRDPRTLETLHVSGPAIYGQVLGFEREQGERGAGDCDDSAIAMGALLESIGFPTRIVTTSPPVNAPSLFSHVFVQAQVPKVGWYSVDPVGFPQHGPGWTPPHSRIAYWDHNGNLLGYQGQFPESFQTDFSGTENEGETAMNEFPDMGLGEYTSDEYTEPADWAQEGLLGFGAYANQMGIINGDRAPLLMEYDEDDEIPTSQGFGVVRTKMLEMSPVDYQHVLRYGAPRMGSVALGDDGDVYQWQQDQNTGLGFFKKLFKRVRSGIKKGLKWVGSKAKKLISKLPGGKYLVKLHNKIHKIAMKIVRPLTKFVGKYAKKLAPIAAMIPGYGPAIAGALYTSGKIADTLKKFGVTTDKKGKPKFKSGEQAKQFQLALKKQARKMAKKRGKPIERERPQRTRFRPPSGRLLRAGTREHRAFLRGLGLN